MKQRLYENFKFHFPLIAEKVVRYRDISPYELEVSLLDGSVFMYDELNKSIRKRPRDCDHMTEEECKREFGMRLRSVMFMRGVDQADLCRLTGIPQPSISNYVNGRTCPSFYNLDKIARALKCSVDELRYTK
jgi:DNA-binding Xre family transcriptional regulator